MKYYYCLTAYSQKDTKKSIAKNTNTYENGRYAEDDLKYFDKERPHPSEKYEKTPQTDERTIRRYGLAANRPLINRTFIRTYIRTFIHTSGNRLLISRTFIRTFIHKSKSQFQALKFPVDYRLRCALRRKQIEHCYYWCRREGKVGQFSNPDIIVLCPDIVVHPTLLILRFPTQARGKGRRGKAGGFFHGGSCGDACACEGFDGRSSDEACEEFEPCE